MQKAFNVHGVEQEVIGALKYIAARKQMKIADMLEWLVMDQALIEDSDYADLYKYRDALDAKRK